jgi:hypothetical protein
MARYIAETLFYVVLLTLCSCAVMMPERDGEERFLLDTLTLVREVKEFERTLGIEPTEALLRSSQQKPVTSMLWIWLQKLGTIATHAPIDVRVGIRFSVPKEQIPLDQIYRAPGYSHYFRQGNQFGDEGSVITLDFAQERMAAQVKVIIHEDLHDDRNFDLPWEHEEALITPIGMLAALEFLRHKNDPEGVDDMERAIREERQLSRELTALVREAEQVFSTVPLLEGREKVNRLLASYPVYSRYYSYQVKDQDADLALEAKLSHDLAYYRYFDRVVTLYERAGDLKAMILELKKQAGGSNGQNPEQLLQILESKYGQKAGVTQTDSSQSEAQKINVSK